MSDVETKYLYEIIETSTTNYSWSQAHEECESRNMSLPNLTEYDIIELLQTDNKMINNSIWLDGRCGWNLNQPGTSGHLELHFSTSDFWIKVYYSLM